MMKIEYQVCSLELAQKLEKLGVKQESYFWWVNRTAPPYNEAFWFVSPLPKLRDEAWNVIPKDCTADDVENAKKLFEHYELGNYSAFTVAELGEMLKRAVNIDLPLWDASNSDYVGHVHYGGVTASLIADTEADARTKMIIYLLENKLISL
jgi:hypothetical protein